MTETKYASVQELMYELSREIWKVLGLAPDTRLQHLLNPLLWPPLRRFSEWAAKFDRTVGDAGFQEAAQELLPRLVNHL